MNAGVRRRMLVAVLLVAATATVVVRGHGASHATPPPTTRLVAVDGFAVAVPRTWHQVSRAGATQVWARTDRTATATLGVVAASDAPLTGLARSTMRSLLAGAPGSQVAPAQRLQSDLVRIEGSFASRAGARVRVIQIWRRDEHRTLDAVATWTIVGTQAPPIDAPAPIAASR